MKPLTNETKIEKKSKRIKRGTIKFITPVPYAHLDDNGEIVVVLLRDLIEAQKSYESALQAKEREMVQEIEKWMNDEIIDGYGRALVIDVEQWKKLKSKLSNLSEK